ncbi:hypothetical protein SLEP1_g41997 [Rubroshorea leprosula]|uniref:Uncharacterized protein n=1 Tax=Rubroshorea leprosula TaxID=152421 RepID=A0AAV5L8Y6_9ROSI|nr:hypothetical protein SLEP1_g41997 [Rubroshorea leprosula]
MLELSGFPATQACWSRSVLPPPMTLPSLSAFGFWEVLAVSSVQPTTGLDFCPTSWRSCAILSGVV